MVSRQWVIRLADDWRSRLGRTGDWLMRRTLVVMAKAPIPGEVKTRLCPPLDPQTAAPLHECFVLDVLEKASAVPDVELVISYTPAGSRTFFQNAAPHAAGFLLQKGRDAGEQMGRCFRRLCQPGRAVVIIGTDCPTLPARGLELAFDALASGGVDFVIGPLSDGGCYLVGMTSLHPELFADMDWNATDVPEKSIEHAAELGLGWYRLPEWYSVERPADLACLKAELLECPVGNSSARRTAAFLKRLAQSGLV